jgi:hypothetical protein
MIKVGWRKLIRRVGEGEFMDAIIAYNKRPWLRDQKGIVQYEYLVAIDLWIVRVRFDWLGKQRDGS